MVCFKCTGADYAPPGETSSRCPIVPEWACVRPTPAVVRRMQDESPADHPYLKINFHNRP